MFELLKNIIAPKKCYSCCKEWFFLCNSCFEEIEKKNPFDEICYVCKKYSKDFEIHNKCKKEIFYDKTIIASHYKENLIKRLIKDYKFYWRKDILNDFWEILVEKIIKYMKEELQSFRKKDFLVVCPPMDFFKKIKRWYNHSELLAIFISKYFWFRFEKNLVLKTRKTRQQSKLSRQKRILNLEKAFKINDKKVDIVDNKVVLIIDDVISTGTTVNEISRVLKKSKAKKVIVISIASD